MWLTLMEFHQFLLLRVYALLDINGFQVTRLVQVFVRQDIYITQHPLYVIPFAEMEYLLELNNAMMAAMSMVMAAMPIVQLETTTTVQPQLLTEIP